MLFQKIIKSVWVGLSDLFDFACELNVLLMFFPGRHMVCQVKKTDT